MSIDLNDSVATTARVRDTCLCLHVQRAARVLARQFDEALRPVGLTHGQFSLLNGLNRPGPTPRAAILSLLSIDRTTLTAVAKPLARRGLVVVVADPRDRRSRLLSITPAGRELLAVATPIWAATHAEIEQGLPPEVPPRVRADLDSLARRHQGAPP
jgi:DNA-binding MarR family transcriptional regulator